MNSISKLVVTFCLLFYTAISAAENDKSTNFIELSTENWVFSLPSSWALTETKRGLRADSADEVYAVFISTYTTPQGLSPSEWAENNIQIVKDAKYSGEDNDFKLYKENVDLENFVQTIELDGYDKTNSFRIYTKHYRIGNIFVALSFHDYWCQSYKVSVELSNELLSKFKIKT